LSLSLDGELATLFTGSESGGIEPLSDAAPVEESIVQYICVSSFFFFARLRFDRISIVSKYQNVHKNLKVNSRRR
jgi:hypothetical protein